jgi:hypothetical protein
MDIGVVSSLINLQDTERQRERKVYSNLYCIYSALHYSPHLPPPKILVIHVPYCLGYVVDHWDTFRQ